MGQSRNAQNSSGFSFELPKIVSGLSNVFGRNNNCLAIVLLH